MPDVRLARFPEDAALVAALFGEYAQGLGINLSFQHFDDELVDIAGHYPCSEGGVLLAFDGGQALGCVAVHACAWPDIAELKRLYLRPASRGLGVGRRLAEAAIARAWDCGYTRIRLDTLPDMQAAQRLYAELGFREIQPYRHNPVAGTRYLERTRRP